MEAYIAIVLQVRYSLTYKAQGRLANRIDDCLDCRLWNSSQTLRTQAQLIVPYYWLEPHDPTWVEVSVVVASIIQYEYKLELRNCLLLLWIGKSLAHEDASAVSYHSLGLIILP
jgi:hypothetical protein